MALEQVPVHLWREGQSPNLRLTTATLVGTDRRRGKSVNKEGTGYYACWSAMKTVARSVGRSAWKVTSKARKEGRRVPFGSRDHSLLPWQQATIVLSGDIATRITGITIHLVGSLPW